MLPHPDPFSAFADWYADAIRAQPRVPDAMQIATVDGDGSPRVRTVLMKDHGPDGFVFYTNLHSRKGQDLLSDPRAACAFHWECLERQVLLEGRVTPVRDEEADAYFASRPRGSQIGAWASRQSQPIEHRKGLEDAVAEVEAEYADRPVPRPPHWSGFRIRPHRVEFWQGQPDRLHDRTVFLREGREWRKERWQP